MPDGPELAVKRSILEERLLVPIEIMGTGDRGAFGDAGFTEKVAGNAFVVEFEQRGRAVPTAC